MSEGRQGIPPLNQRNRPCSRLLCLHDCHAALTKRPVERAGQAAPLDDQSGPPPASLDEINFAKFELAKNLCPFTLP